MANVAQSLLETVTTNPNLETVIKAIFPYATKLGQRRDGKAGDVFSVSSWTIGSNADIKSSFAVDIQLAAFKSTLDSALNLLAQRIISNATPTTIDVMAANGECNTFLVVAVTRKNNMGQADGFNFWFKQLTPEEVAAVYGEEVLDEMTA